MNRHMVFGQLVPAAFGAARRRRAVTVEPADGLGSTAVAAALTPKLPRWVGE